MRGNKLNYSNDEYENKYGHLPNTTEELLKYIENNYKLDKDKLKKERERINDIKIHKLDATLFLIPKGGPRPRRGKFGNFYVKGAKDLQKEVRNQLSASGMIVTRTLYQADIYLETPKEFSKNNMYLEEEKLIRPLTKPDWDNLGKPYCDALIKFLLLDDNIICTGIVNKYYSIKPRIELHLEYQEDFDCNYNKYKILKSKTFKDFINS